MENINLGIDLGTTNSVVAIFKQGEVQVFRNPISWKETLTSVVAFRKKRITVGEKAREFLEKDPKNVFGGFKRKMGTAEKYQVASLGKEISPVELSSHILKELKTFLPPEEKNDAAVVTIPASFDTVQSNATKESGFMAGFRQVVLLQEPIAASLAYANQNKTKELENGYWLVYDLGGGTFDVALVKIQEEEMRIVDHQGDNFLGGRDFDAGIVEKLIIPFLNRKYTFDNFEKELKSAKGKYNKDWYVLLNKAEDAKIQLSRQKSTEIEILMTDDVGNEVDELFELSREEFESIIEPSIQQTVDMIKAIISENQLVKNEIQFILMVGGSTYIPFVREKLKKELEIDVNCEIDPTTAVAFGAAYYAGTKPKELPEQAEESSQNNEEASKQAPEASPELKIKMAYEKASKDTEVFFAAKVEGHYRNYFYKIYREDGGFDTGLKQLEEKINESLPLVKNSYNYFQLKVYDRQNNEVETNVERIGITQGKYSIVGQPLPEDICLEIDNPELNETELHVLFKKNSILPIKKTETRLINKTIKAGSNDKFIINVMEGTAKSIPVANKTIGFMEINGKKLKRDLIKGADIELEFEISESRDLKIIAYIPMLDQEFIEIFKPSKRHIPVERLIMEINDLINSVDEEIATAVRIEDYENAKKLNGVKSELEKLKENSHDLSEDDITDKRYQIEDKKRKMASLIYESTKDKHINKLSHDYFSEKLNCKMVMNRIGNNGEKERFKKITGDEKEIMNANNPRVIKEKIRELQELMYSALWRDSNYLLNIFEWLKTRRNEFRDTKQAESLIDSGNKAVQEENYNSLRQVNISLLNLLPPETKQEAINRATGLL